VLDRSGVEGSALSELAPDIEVRDGCQQQAVGAVDNHS
jgi:hypothetical protein